MHTLCLPTGEVPVCLLRPTLRDRRGQLPRAWRRSALSQKAIVGAVPADPQPILYKNAVRLLQVAFL